MVLATTTEVIKAIAPTIKSAAAQIKSKLIQWLRSALPPWTPLPFIEGDRVPLVPVDYLARAIVELAHAGCTANKRWSHRLFAACGGTGNELIALQPTDGLEPRAVHRSPHEIGRQYSIHGRKLSILGR